MLGRQVDNNSCFQKNLTPNLPQQSRHTTIWQPVYKFMTTSRIAKHNLKKANIVSLFVSNKRLYRISRNICRKHNHLSSVCYVMFVSQYMVIGVVGQSTASADLQTRKRSGLKQEIASVLVQKMEDDSALVSYEIICESKRWLTCVATSNVKFIGKWSKLSDDFTNLYGCFCIGFA